MRKATLNPPETDFTLTPRRSRRHPTITITDTNFADGIALLSDNVEKAQLLLTRGRTSCRDYRQREFMTFNQGEIQMKSSSGKQLKCVLDFKYLGSWIDTCEKDIDNRIGMAWAAANKMDTIWKSNMNKNLKIRF